MAKQKFSFTSENVINCLVYGIIGLLLVIMKAGSLGILMTIVGALLIVVGVLDIAKEHDTVKGLIELGFGIAIIVCGWLIADVVLLILGIVLIVKSVMELVKNYKNGFMANLSTIVTLVIGVLLVIAKWTLIDVMCIIAGVIFLINAVLALFGKQLTK